MLPNASSVAASVRTAGHSAVAIGLDADFDVRWAAWRARGLAHERAVRRKLALVAGVAAALATVFVIAYTLLRP